MGKLFKFVFAALSILLLLVGLLALYLFTIFDPNDYKAEIQQLVKQHTQLELAIEGDLALSLFPWLGISAGNISVNSQEQELASVKGVQVFAKLKPLLDGQLVVDGVKLDGLKLNLIVDQNGRGNWEIDSTDSETEAATGQQATPAEASLAALSVGTVSIENADISYRDLQQKTHHQLLGLTLHVSNPQLKQSFPLSADFKYLNADGASSVPVHLTTKINIDLPNQQLQLSDMAIDLDKARIVGRISAEQFQQEPKVTMQLKVSELNPSHWAALLQNPMLKDIDMPIDLELASNLDSAQDRLTLESFSLKSKLLEVQGDADIEQLSIEPQAAGKIQFKTGDLKRLLEMTGSPLSTQDPKALSWLDGNFSFKAGAQSLDIKDLALTLDDTKLNGWFGVRNFDKPAISFSLAGDTINLDRYLPPETETDTNSTAAKTASVSSPASKKTDALLLPIALLRELNIRGGAQFKSLTASGLTLENLNIKTKANNGFINLEQVKGDIYEGSFNANGTIDARGKTAQMQFNKTLKNMQAGPVLKALAEVDYVSGKLNLNINANAVGNSMERIKSSLNGKADFSVTEGILKEINLEHMVCEGIAQVRQLQLAPSEQTDTRFNKLDGSMTIANGVVKMNALNIGLNKLKARGSGTVSLPKETLNFSIKTTLLGDLENKACEVHERYRDIGWPIRCAGSWNDDPSDLCSLDRKGIQKIIGRLAEKELKRKATEKLEEKLRDRFGDEFGEQLKQILNF